jgi:serine/threonine-protein kinase
VAEQTKPTVDVDHLANTELAATEVAGVAVARSAPTAAPSTPAPRAIGRFRIDAQLGSGGMGDVYRAHDPTLDRAVALKVLRAGGTDDDALRMRRVLREARAAAALTHPNTVTIFEVGEADREVFIAMELLVGEDLRAVIVRGDAPLEDKLRWLREAARALGAAHERGLVHRDVKPENMFVCKDGALKLLDFGIAKRDDDDAPADAAPSSVGPSSLRTAAGLRVGTPRYMAPEQLAGEGTDPRTDEYAWGLVAYELLTGADPEASPDAVTREASDDAAPAKREGHLANLRARVPLLPQAVGFAIGRALSPRREDRFPSMAPIVAALEARSDAGASLPSSVGQGLAPPRASAPSTASPPTRGSSRALAWVGAAVVAATTASAFVVLRAFAARAPRDASPAVAPLAHGPAPACVVVSTQAVAVTANDRVALLPDGAIVVARDIRRGIVMERIAPEGAVPFLQSPMFEALAHEYEDLGISGVTVGGQPAVLARIAQPHLNSQVVGVWSERAGFLMHRVPGSAVGLAGTGFREGVVVLATTRDVRVNQQPYVGGADLYLLGGGGRPRHVALERGRAGATAVAASADSIAIAYVTDDGLRSAVFDADLARLGDVLTVSADTSAPAVAFAGARVVLFFMHDYDGKRRLTEASYAPGEAVVGAPKVAVDEAVLTNAPLTARLPNGAFAVMWVATVGGVAKLRASPVGPDGALTGPTTLASGASFVGLTATSSDLGVDLVWSESPTSTRVARVSCAR